MRTAAKVGLSFGAIFGGVVLFTVVAPEQTHSVVKALSLDKTAAKWQYHHGFMGKENSAWKEVDWETVKAAKIGFFERAKDAQSAEDVHPLAAGLRARVVRAGVPEDHVDSMVSKWVTAAGACNAKEGAEKEECYKKASEPCGHHGSMGKDNSAWKDVNWETVKAAKMGFFESAKKAQSAEEVRPLAAGLRAQVVTAGVPEDHVDLFVNKWMESAQACHGKESAEKDECYKTALEWHYHSHHDAAQPAVGAATTTECAKYEGKGEFVVNGCSKCAKYYPGQVDQCMTCGGTCGRKVCDKNNFWDCVTTAPFKECHRACMTEDASAPEQRPSLRLIRLHRLFSAISQKFWGLVGNVYGFMG